MAGLRQRIASLGRPGRSLLAVEATMVGAHMVGHVALPWWVAHEGGAGDLLTYGVVLAGATLLAMPAVAPLAERASKRRQIALGLALRTLAAVSAAVLATLGHYSLPLLLLAGLAAVLADACVLPASNNVAAELVPARLLPQALSLQRAAQSLGRIVGPLMAGLTLAVAGTAAALWLNATLLLVATLAARGMARADGADPARHMATAAPAAAPEHAGHAAPNAAPPAHAAARWWHELRAGLAAKWAIPLERGWTAVNFFVWIFLGPAIGLLLPLKLQSLGLSGAWLGACETALSLGMLAGALWGAELLSTRFGRYRARVGAAIAEGLLLAVAGATAQPLGLVLLFALAGFANATLVIVGQTHRLLATPVHYRMRFSAVNMSCTQIAAMLGPALAGAALLHWPLGTVYSAFGLAVALGASCWLWVPRAREFFALEHAEVAQWYAREYPAQFGGPAPIRTP